MRQLVFFLALVWCRSLSAQATQPHPVWDPATAKWTSAGEGLESSDVLGDAGKAGAYAIAFRLKPGSWIPPHSHPRAKQVTVLSGTLRMGFGPVLDSAAVGAVGAGRIMIVPPGTAHYEGASVETVVVFSGDGPLVTNWIKAPAKPTR